jgi:hypothetical protein
MAGQGDAGDADADAIAVLSDEPTEDDQFGRAGLAYLALIRSEVRLEKHLRSVPA